MSENFSKGKRDSVVTPDPSKPCITIRLDADLISHFKSLVSNAGGGNYQTLINDALRTHIEDHNKTLEVTLRKVIRNELQELKKVVWLIRHNRLAGGL